MNNIKIIEQTDDYLIVDKPHGLHVVADRYDESIPTLKGELEKEFGRIFIVHRLDSGTGGVMVVARNAEAHKFFNSQFEKDEINKKYLAIVKGCMSEAVTIMLPISKQNQKGRYKINFKSGRESVTQFVPVAADEKMSLVECYPKTGRTHQIRVHLRAHKHPLYKDFLYNERIDDRRLTLQAVELELTLTEGIRKKYFSPVSPYMAEIGKRCEKIEKYFLKN